MDVNASQEGYVFQPTRSVLVQLSEMGVLYRKITTFIKKHQAAGPSAKSGMVVQVGVMRSLDVD
jgi:gamma-tubulin complex component 3